jgi:hypothetical protein
MTVSSRSSSSSSASSRTSSLGHIPSRYTPFDLESRATHILTSLANNPSSVLPHISPMIQVEHNDNDPVYSIDLYVSRFSSASSDIRLDIKEACVDELQRKVWVRSEISGYPGGVVKESVDMLFFDEAGMLIKGIDYQKVKRRW